MTKHIFFSCLFCILLFSQSCKNKPDNVIITQLYKDYQENSLLDDETDKKLNKLDTILYFSNIKFFYEVKLQKEKVTICVYRWDELPDNKISWKETGFQKNGYCYIFNEQKQEYELEYKIILDKGMFSWDGHNWVLFNAEDF